MTSEHVLHTDGGSRGNPGPAGAAYVLQDPAGRVVSGRGRFLGIATNNVAEYEALLDGLEAALARGVEVLLVRSDSELLVRQLAGEYRVKNEGLKPLFERARELLAAFASARVTHIPRRANVQADSLANGAMDAAADVSWEDLESSGEAEEIPTGLPVPGGGAQPALFGEQRESWELTVRSHFDAAHALRGYEGECRELHGHTWDVEVTVRGGILDDIGIVYDFKTLKADLAAVLNTYDHGYLNEIAPFDRLNATAENLARVVFESLEREVADSVQVVEVAVWESPIARIAYRRG